MNDKFEEHACEFKNEAECEEELDSEGLDMRKEESKHFSDEDELDLDDEED